MTQFPECLYDYDKPEILSKNHLAEELQKAYDIIKWVQKKADEQNIEMDLHHELDQIDSEIDELGE